MNEAVKTVDELDRELQTANDHVERALKSLVSNFQTNGPEWNEYQSAVREQLAIERAFAAAKGEEHVIPIEFPVEWDAGATIQTSGSKFIITFCGFTTQRSNVWRSRSK